MYFVTHCTHIICVWREHYVSAYATTTYLHAGSATSLKNTQVPPFKQKASPITGHGWPACVQLLGDDEWYPNISEKNHI